MTDFNQQGQHVHTQLNVGNITIHVHQQTRPDVAAQLQRAVRCVQQQRYEDAVKLLEAVLLEDDTIADAFYYYALGLLKGKRPRLSTRALAEKMERAIGTACRIAPGEAHYYYLWAWLKYDFYLVNGFLVPEPDLPSILEKAGRCRLDVPKCKEMLQHSDASNSVVAGWINARL